MSGTAGNGRPVVYLSLDQVRRYFPQIPEKYLPPPGKHRVFVEIWASMINPILERKTFNPAHLVELRTICDLHVELDELNRFIKKHGRTYESTHSRTGVTTIRERPENLAKDRLLRAISRHMKLLGLFPTAKDVVGLKPPKEEDNGDWT